VKYQEIARGDDVTMILNFFVLFLREYPHLRVAGVSRASEGARTAARRGFEMRPKCGPPRGSLISR
jgi:hypothetical protein